MTLVSVAFTTLSTLLADPGADFAASAETLAVIVNARATIARTYPAQAAPYLSANDTLATGLSSLSGQAMALSLRMEETNGPEDLRCIYRGMAQDALLHIDRLAKAELRADRLAVYADIGYLLQHAQEIGPLADQDEIAPFTGVPPDCPRGPLP
ncbi:hypothetical protein [Hyphobacterium sp.]|uniref:hypothetical protein n=1 Tax=Hyphobacterium sp. TaxID=2004662 RepID=UPI003B5199D4